MKNLEKQALAYHKQDNKPGKIEVTPTKPLETSHDLSLAYSPGVAFPCLEIQENPKKAALYTAKSNLVAVITNGTAVLGLGNIGALASKPVMEGKAVLFKKFADIDSVDIEVDTKDVDEFVRTVELISPTFGAINLEDIKAPECFEIEKQLKEKLDIPVFHDDQHGTAIVTLAGLINALEIANKKIENVKIVINGAGAAAIAICELLKDKGAKNITLCDSKGVIYKNRPHNMNKYKAKHTIKTKDRTLEDAVKNADIFIGVSVANVLKKEMLLSMNSTPIVFALANPNPEIKPDLAKNTRKDVIIASGRSDFPNQVNNVLCFPFIFKGALQAKAKKITQNMKIAAAEAIASITKKTVSKELLEAYNVDKLKFGPEYIIPKPFDKRLKTEVTKAVYQQALKDKKNGKK